MSKKFIVELTPEELKMVENWLPLQQYNALRDCRKVKEIKTSPFDRVEENEMYYTISAIGKVMSFVDERDSSETELYEVANYCTDIDLLQQQAYRETSNRLLWRFSMQNGGMRLIGEIMNNIDVIFIKII